MGTDISFFCLVKLTPRDVFNVLPDLLSALINMRFLQVRGATILILVFVVNLPLVVSSVYYLILSEKFVLRLERWLMTNPTRREVNFRIFVAFTLPPLGERSYCTFITEQYVC